MSLLKINISNFDALIFDLGGVVLNLNYDLTISRFKELGGDNFDKLYTQASQDLIFDKYETGEINSDDFVNYLLDFLPDTTSQADVIQAWNAMILDLPKYRVEFLKNVRSVLPIFLFSNTNDLHYKYFNSEIEKSYDQKNLLNGIFDKCYYSHLVGFRKPNAEAFELVLNEQNLEAEKVLFIDDSIQHIEGARGVGIKTHHLVESDICEIITFS